jgi:hypothetical protein
VLRLFDFPDPNGGIDQRSATNVPLQGLFFMNSDLMWQEAGIVASLASRLGLDDGDEACIQKAYRLLFGRQAKPGEVADALEFLAATAKDSGGRKPAWQQLTQALLSSGEFNYIN